MNERVEDEMAGDSDAIRSRATELPPRELPVSPAMPEVSGDDMTLARSAAPIQSIEERIIEICGCTMATARHAVLAAGPGGLPLAIDIVLSGGIEAPAPKKLVCLVRQDLKMGPGKVAAQVAHSVLGAYRQSLERNPQQLREWEDDGEACIVLAVPTLEVLDSLLSHAARIGLITYTVKDAGRTEVASGTITVGCIGPGLAREIDDVTGKLMLY